VEVATWPWNKTQEIVKQAVKEEMSTWGPTEQMAEGLAATGEWKNKNDCLEKGGKMRRLRTLATRRNGNNMKRI
jgi:hypothetical protein